MSTEFVIGFSDTCWKALEIAIRWELVIYRREYIEWINLLISIYKALE